MKGNTLQTELHFKFDTTENIDYHIITHAKKYYDIVDDLEGWLDNELRKEQQYYDKETLEYVQDKLNEIMLNYNIDI